MGGKTAFFIIVLFLASRTYTASIELRALDNEGIELKEVGAGQPCMFEVSLHGDRLSMQRPMLKSDPPVDIKFAGMKQFMINNKSHITYLYRTRIDKPGKYTIGPAIIKASDTNYESNPLYLTVGEKHVQSDGAIKKNLSKSSPFIFQISVNKNDAYVGEKTVLTLRFFYEKQLPLKITQIIKPTIADFMVNETEHSQEGTKEFKGNLYKYIEWKWYIYPQKAGNYTIPAFGLEFEIPTSQRTVSFGHLNFLLGNHNERKRIYSNALSLNIEQLPDHAEKVGAIGIFTSFKASIKPAAAKQGEGMVLLFELEGEGNLETLETMPLRGMPNALKYYDSKKYTENVQENKQKKVFEYIVQGMETGDWEIPSQSFTYFDTEPKKYRTLESPSILVTILPNTVMSRQDFAPLPTNQEPQQEQHDGLLPLAHYGPWNEVPERSALPTSIFLTFLLLPIIILVCWQSSRFFMRKISSNSRVKIKKLFKTARERLYGARKNNSPDFLYYIFSQLGAALFQEQKTSFLDDCFEHLVFKDKLSPDEIMQWQSFFTHVREYAFGYRKINQEENDIFRQAEQWINRLETIL